MERAVISTKPRRGFPAKYVKVKLFLLEEDRDYLDKVAQAQQVDNRSVAGRIVIANARAHQLFLNSNDAKMEPMP